MAKQVQCNRCGYIFDSEDEEFGYCPCCDNNQIDVPKFLKIQEDEFNVIYINLRDIVKIQECLEEDKYILYSSRGEYYKVPSNKKTSAIVECLLNQLL